VVRPGPGKQGAVPRIALDLLMLYSSRVASRWDNADEGAGSGERRARAGRPALCAGPSGQRSIGDPISDWQDLRTGYTMKVARSGWKWITRIGSPNHRLWEAYILGDER
jgi:hypothetical protein